jgi:hypothetical protein
MRLLLSIGFLIVTTTSWSQYSREGQVTVIQDSRIDSVLYHYNEMRLKILENADNKAIEGYRIQIFFDSGPNSSDRAKQEKEEFMSEFPEIPAYVSWKAPNYRVRVGDFRTRLEAEKALQIIAADYPNAWVIKDEINFPVL